MPIQRNTLVAIIIILILFILVGGFFCSRENEKILQGLLTSFSKQQPKIEKADEGLISADYAPGRLLVRFKDNVPEEKQKKMLKDWGFTLEKEIKQIKVKVVSVPEQAEEALAKALSKNPNIDWAEPDYIAEVLSIPNDTWFSKQWGMVKTQTPEAWDITTGSSSINIAILDTGIDLDHSDLAGKIINSINFSSSTTTDDIYGHGTHVSGIAAAITNNGIGVAGLGYDSTIMNVKVLADNGSGPFSVIASGIIWAADNGAEVINMSLGGTLGSLALEDAVNYAWNKGVVVVAAAGNNGSSVKMYPAAYENSIAVAATGQNDERMLWSSYGDWVDVAAPGGGIYSTIRGTTDAYGYMSGTSMASPHVAGLAALVFTTVTDTNGNGLLNDEVRSQIEATCDDIGVINIGSGRINAYKAVASIGATPPPDTTPPTVSITSPLNNSTVSKTIPIILSAYDNVDILKVEIYKDGVLFATDNASPYSFTWDTTKDTNGSHRLEAKAYDTSNNTATSAVTVTVNNVLGDTTPPTVSITSPLNNSTVAGTVSVNVSASDNVGISKVELYKDGTLFATDQTSPIIYSFTWYTTQETNGSHKLEAKAYDTSNNTAISVVTVTVSNAVPDTTPPTVSITSPLNNSTVSKTILISVSASDNVGISKVELYKDGVLFITDSTSPYGFLWDTTKDTNDSHRLEAKAYDTSNNTATSVVTVTVSNVIPDTTPPTVSITSPQNNSTVAGTVSVNVSASDNVGISKVELYKDGVLFATDQTLPYSFAWDTNQDTNGSHKLEAKAYDTSNNISVSTIYVTVSNVIQDTTPPTVSITSPADDTIVPKKGKLLISVTAQDNVKVTQIDLFINYGLITSCFNTNACFINFNLAKLKAGTHNITAKAYDARNNIGTAGISIIKQ